MQVTEIKTGSQVVYEPAFTKLESTKANPAPTQTDKIDLSKTSASWQKDILLSGLEMLENNIQLDNNHPLDRVSNAPIETFDEAVIELNFLKSSDFKEQASGAQANIDIRNVAQLFLEEVA